MRGRPCSICQRNDPAIDAALVAGNTILHVAATFSVPKSTVHRHLRNCLEPKIKAAAKVMQRTNEARAPVIRAREIASGAVPTPQEVLSLTSLLDRIGRSLDRLEHSAVAASSDGLHSALAALSGQISRSVEVAARMQNIGYKDTPQGQQQAGFSVQIVIPQLDTKQTGNSPVTIDCTPERGSEAPVPQVTARHGAAYDFCLDQDDD